MRHRPVMLFAVSLLALFVCAAAGELVLRAHPELMSVRWQTAHPGAQEGPTFSPPPDDELGYVYQVTPGTDRYGFPNTEPWPAGASIVFLGDSLLSASGVGPEAGFTNLVARALPGEPVLNLGLAAAGPERQFRIYRKFASDLHPRIVVAGLYLAADFENDAATSRGSSSPRARGFSSSRGAFSARLQGTHEPYVDWTTALRTLKFGRVLEKSRVYSRAADFVHQIRSPYPTRYRAGDGTDMFFDEMTVRFAAQAASKQDARIGALIDSVGRLRDYVAAQGGDVVVMLIPSKEELFAVPTTVSSSNLVAHTSERLREAGFAVLDLYPAIRKGADSAAPFFSQDIHLTAPGNRPVADEFVSWFRAHAPRPSRSGGGA